MVGSHVSECALYKPLTNRVRGSYGKLWTAFFPLQFNMVPQLTRKRGVSNEQASRDLIARRSSKQPMTKLLLVHVASNK